LQNVASDIIQGKVLTSKSGTLAYLAPEVYAGNGYDVRADWWSLGVLFYECIYNKVRNAHPSLGLGHGSR
jgi:serine/threonine kinase 32